MIPLQEIEDIKKGPAKVKINSITFDYPDQVLINGYKLSDLIDAAEAYGDIKAKSVNNPMHHEVCPHCGSSHVITTTVITIDGGTRAKRNRSMPLS